MTGRTFHNYGNPVHRGVPISSITDESMLSTGEDGLMKSVQLLEVGRVEGGLVVMVSSDRLTRPSHLLRFCTKSGRGKSGDRGRHVNALATLKARRRLISSMN